MATKSSASTQKQAKIKFGKRRVGKAIKRNQQRDNTEQNYKGQGR
jgi:ribosomal protein L7Ae-like RNA K-turn-binding protein